MSMEYTVNEAKDEIKDSIRVYMMKDEAGKYIIPENKKNPFYLIGAPGIGKTEMVGQIARELGIEFMATSLTHHTRNSVLGLPVITEIEGEKSTEYTMPDILAQIVKINKSQKKEGILLIDEFASMSEALVAPMLAFLQNKSIGNHRLPEGWVMVLCSNPPEYNETAREFDAAVLDRVRIMNIVYSKEDFLKYGEENGFHPVVLSYVKEHGNNVYICDKDKENKQIVTTRGWENLSQCLYGYEKIGSNVTSRLIYQFIKSENIANDFYNYYCLNNLVLSKSDFDNILSGHDIDNNIKKVMSMEYTKKLQVINVIKNKLIDNIKKSVKYAKLRDYLFMWIDEWKKNNQMENIEETTSVEHVFCEADQDYYTVLSIRAQRQTAAIRGLTMPDIFSTRECDDIELKMLDEIIDDLEKLRDNNKSFITNEDVLKAMHKWYDNTVQKMKKGIDRDNKKIDNTIHFVSMVDNGSMTEMFLRNINCDDNVLYIVGRMENKSYVEQMARLYEGI